MKKRLSVLTEDGKKHYDVMILVENIDEEGKEDVYPLMNLEQLNEAFREQFELLKKYIIKFKEEENKS